MGSASPDADQTRLEYAHSLVSNLVEALAEEGASFIVPFGKEPLLKDRNDGPSIIFDWTVAETIHRVLERGAAQPRGTNGRLIATLATSKVDAHIPPHRQSLFDTLQTAEAIEMEFLPAGWSGGAFRRQRFAQRGDVLIGLSGGEGVEHAALEYSSKGKPVVPFDLDLGASMEDGSGGASRLFTKALERPTDFFQVEAGYSAADLLLRIRTKDASVVPTNIVPAVMNLLRRILPPRAFYVRLLNKDTPEFSFVEQFFRNTIDPFVTELGYEPVEMGRGKNEYAWMQQAIFDSLHHSSVAIVDLTALRQNCFMELGYALGNKQRVIITAREGTKISFDASPLEAFFWKDSEDVTARTLQFRKHWERNIDMPTVVQPKEAR